MPAEMDLNFKLTDDMCTYLLLELVVLLFFQLSSAALLSLDPRMPIEML